METTVKKQNYFIPIIVMILLFGMISLNPELARHLGRVRQLHRLCRDGYPFG